MAKAKTKERFLSCDSDELAKLANPALEFLEVWHVRAKPLDARLSLLSAAKLPALRRLDFVRQSKDKAISLDFLEALLTSKLLHQLEWLAFRQEVLNTKGVNYLLERREPLAHLRGIFIHTCERAVERKIIDTFGTQSEDRPLKGHLHCIGAWQTWPHPSPNDSKHLPADLIELRNSHPDAIERYWKAKPRT